MKNTLLTAVLLATITACSGGNSPPEVTFEPNTEDSTPQPQYDHGGFHPALTMDMINASMETSKFGRLCLNMSVFSIASDTLLNFRYGCASRIKMIMAEANNIRSIDVDEPITEWQFIEYFSKSEFYKECAGKLLSNRAQAYCLEELSNVVDWSNMTFEDDDGNIVYE